MLTLLVLVAGMDLSEVDQRLLRMATLYDEVCLKTFPDDKAVETLMKGQAARELSPSEVTVTMRDDPARGWELKSGEATVWIEFPPYHACSVRWNSPKIDDLAPYRTVADDYERAQGGFEFTKPLEADQGDIHIHLVGEQRTLSDGRTESLMVVDQQIANPKRRAAGETGVVLRFVHQFAPPAKSD
jgi:hypothetical protein